MIIPWNSSMGPIDRCRLQRNDQHSTSLDLIRVFELKEEFPVSRSSKNVIEPENTRFSFLLLDFQREARFPFSFEPDLEEFRYQGSLSTQ